MYISRLKTCLVPAKFVSLLNDSTPQFSCSTSRFFAQSVVLKSLAALVAWHTHGDNWEDVPEVCYNRFNHKLQVSLFITCVQMIQYQQFCSSLLLLIPSPSDEISLWGFPIVPLVWLPEKVSLLGWAILLLNTFGSLFLLPEPALPFGLGFLLPVHWLPVAGLALFLLPRISSFFALCFFPPIWAPKLNSVTQSTLQILHQKEGIKFGLGACKACEGCCRTFNFFFEGYQFAGGLCTVEPTKHACGEGI